MTLTNLLSILKSGNVALGHKLNSLLTEDCNILEYTDDAVLFTKNNRLVLAKFKHNLAESKMSAEDVVDNEILYVSGKDTEGSLRESVINVIDNLVEDNYLSAEEELKKFVETYFQYSVLKLKYPELFNENLIKKSKGFSVRKKALSMVEDFRSEVFTVATLKESAQLELADYTSILENTGLVLSLGKKKVLEIVTDSLLGNAELAESITDKLFDVADTLVEANDDLKELHDKRYDLEAGKFGDEDADEVASEDLTAPEEPETDFEGGEESKEFTEFDPAKLSDEELKSLHKTVLTSILSDMQDFVSKKANDASDTDTPADLDQTLKGDLDMLGTPDIADEDLSRIEARWQPVLTYFLSSDMYKPDQDLDNEDLDISDVVSGGENPELGDEEAGEGEMKSAEEAMGEVEAEEKPKETPEEV